MSLFELCKMLQESEIGMAIHSSLYFFPFVETIHVLGLSVSVGTILWFDLRAMGLNMRQQPVSRVFAAVRPWMLAGFIAMFLTGAIMFWAHAALCYLNPSFRVKTVGLVLAGFNALYFHFKTQHGMAEWDNAPTPPLGVRLAGLFSVLLWGVIIAAGRMMAYTPVDY
ncbi:MAG TPA: DUF6644 family protein [Terriglobia bacterium]|nr:DUF6644 family protein [Terriglobia bacterium]